MLIQDQGKVPMPFQRAAFWAPRIPSRRISVSREAATVTAKRALPWMYSAALFSRLQEKLEPARRCFEARIHLHEGSNEAHQGG
jgi:hypothetical protein